MEKNSERKNMFFDRVVSPGGDYKLSDSPYGVHRKIIQFVGKNKKVLDVGCGAGYLGEVLKKNGCYVVGIESDCGRAKQAEKVLDKLIIADVEELDKQTGMDNFFDVIVLADILEHLKRPDIFLVKFKKYLNNDGYLVISVPNIARLDVRLKFLFGKFNYEDGGIMDKTHLRFFTKESACKLLRECGYSVEKIDYSGFFSRFKILGPMLNMLAFQFVFLAKP